MLDADTLKAIGRQLQNLYGVLPRPTAPNLPAGPRQAGPLFQEPGYILLGQPASGLHNRDGRRDRR